MSWGCMTLRKLIIKCLGTLCNCYLTISEHVNINQFGILGSIATWGCTRNTAPKQTRLRHLVAKMYIHQPRTAQPLPATCYATHHLHVPITMSTHTSPRCKVYALPISARPLTGLVTVGGAYGRAEYLPTLAQSRADAVDEACILCEVVCKCWDGFGTVRMEGFGDGDVGVRLDMENSVESEGAKVHSILFFVSKDGMWEVDVEVELFTEEGRSIERCGCGELTDLKS